MRRTVIHHQRTDFCPLFNNVDWAAHENISEGGLSGTAAGCVTRIYTIDVTKFVVPR
jgi:hypothetical protein